MNNTNNFSARESFVHAKNIFINAMLDKFGGNVAACSQWVDSLKFSQSEIRLETVLNANSNLFSFGVTPQQKSSSPGGIVYSTEQRLNLQDSLVVNEYGIFLGNADDEEDTLFPLSTYGNTIRFGAADAAILNSGFYANGQFQIRCNNDVLQPARGLFNHLYIPQTQQTAALAEASPNDQIRGAEDGMITMEPNYVLIGTKNNQPQIVLPGPLTGLAGTNIRVVLVLRGLLAQNSTVVN